MISPGSLLFGQDGHFSQYYASKLYLAPSFAGTTNGSRLTMNFRDQWPQLPNEFIIYTVGFDHYMPEFRSGIGLLIYGDRAGSGALTNQRIALQYSYNFDISQSWTLRPGIQFENGITTLNFNKLTFGDQLSFYGNRPISIENYDRERMLYFDFASSILAYSDNMWFGFSADHLPTPNNTLVFGENDIPIRYYAFAGAKIFEKQSLMVRDESIYYASFIYRRQGDFDQLDVGFYWNGNPVELGLWYRGLPVVKNEYEKVDHDAVVIKIGYYTDYMAIGYSYDFTVSSLHSVTGGAHEVSISYVFNQNRRSKKKYKAIPCPQF